MREKLREMGEMMGSIRVKLREARLKGETGSIAGLEAQGKSLRKSMLCLISYEGDAKTRALLEYRYVEGMKPVYIQHILGLSRSSYYRRLKGR